MNAPIQFQAELSADDIARALYQVLVSLRPNTELLFFRDDDAPPKLEVHYEDGTVEVIGVDAPAGKSIQIIDSVFEAGSHAAWRCVDVGLPEPLTDVLLLQVLRGFDAAEGNTLIRIGFMRVDGSFVATYESNDGSDLEDLETITHWAPMPAEPVGARS